MKTQQYLEFHLAKQKQIVQEMLTEFDKNLNVQQQTRICEKIDSWKLSIAQREKRCVDIFNEEISKNDAKRITAPNRSSLFDRMEQSLRTHLESELNLIRDAAKVVLDAYRLELE